MATLANGCSSDAPRERPEGSVGIGVIYSLSGPDAATGEDLTAGVKLATEIVNGAYDLPLPLARGKGLESHGGRTIDLVFCDAERDPAVAAQCVDHLATDKKVLAIMGCYHSSITAFASEQAEMLRIPFLNACSTSPMLIQRGLKWFFRTTPDDETFSKNFFDFLDGLLEAPGIAAEPRVALVYENGLWGTSVARAQKRLARKHGYRIVGDVSYSADSHEDSDSSPEAFREELDEIEAAMPAFVLQASYAPDALALVKGYRERGMKPPAILGMNAGFISPLFLDRLGPEAENILSREVWALDLQGKKPLVGKVNELFRARHQRDMTGNSARTFTGLTVLAEAIDRARKLEPEAVRQALALTHLEGGRLVMPWDGIRFDTETHQNTLGGGIIVQVQEGRYVTVWPDHMAARSPVLPAELSPEEKGP